MVLEKARAANPVPDDQAVPGSSCVVDSPSYIEFVNDTPTTRPDHEGLFQTASEQAGYFTTAQAIGHGFSTQLITHHTRTGRFVRISRGLYRLRDYPSSPREQLIGAWLRLAPDAVVSHESALELFGLSDVIPDEIHLSVPRTRRRLVRQPGVTVHTTKRPLEGADVAVRDGVRVTAPERTIADVAESGTAPEQVVAAVLQAIERGLTTRERVRGAARSRGKRVERLIGQALGVSQT
jgi:predicted transcriptional regulator of viral defense system